MRKKLPLIMLLLGSSIASMAWAQADCTDDESAADECAGAVDEVSEVDAAADTDEGALASADEEADEEADEDASERGDVDADDDAVQNTDETAEDDAIAPADASSIDEDRDAGELEPAPEPDATPTPVNPQDPVVAPAPNSVNQPCETLQQKFDCARVASANLSERPDNMTALKVYALYQQGSVGDVEGMRPGPTDFVGRAKFDSWAGLKGTRKDDAMAEYVDLINELKGE